MTLRARSLPATEQTEPGRTGRRRPQVWSVLLTVAVVVGVAAGAAAWLRRDTRRAAAGPSAASPWAALDPTGRCTSALALVHYPNQWPMFCRWRATDEKLAGSAFPPPVGDPPWDRPHIEVYVAPTETREEVGHALAHELGHMRLTREPSMVDAWLSARGLPPDTAAQVWVEDYAETFAALFGPPVGHWDAPTPAPDQSALARLRAEFFQP
jgi:hypothetical protein